MKRSPLRQTSKKQAKENRIWSKVKLKRMEQLMEKFDYIPCEYCKRHASGFADGHHNNGIRRENTFENCRIVHRLCHSTIHDKNVMDVRSLL